MSRLGAFGRPAAALAVAVGGWAATAAPAAAAGTAAPQAGVPAIQHVIVIMQGGHSFDNYFGTRKGANGIPAGVCLPTAPRSASCVQPYHLRQDQSRAGLSDTLRTTQRAINGGKMDGFVAAQPNVAIGTTAMGHLDRRDIPYYWSLADRFTLYDNFFASSQAGALPNRVAAVAGQDAGLVTNTPPDGGITVPTVFQQLDQAHVSWRYYVQNFRGAASPPTPGQVIAAPLLAMPAVTGAPGGADHIVDSTLFFDDLADGQLPAVSYVSGTVNSERSPLSPALGEFYVRTLVNAVLQSPAWSHTAILITYDDAGGWYDHVAPPVMGGATQGLRVPALLVSPFSRAGAVDHQALNTASIPGLIDKVFGLPALTPQVAAAGDLLSGTDLAQKPIAPLIAPLAKGATAPPRPNVVVIYGLYLFVLAFALALIGLALRRSRRFGAASYADVGLPAIAGVEDELGAYRPAGSGEHHPDAPARMAAPLFLTSRRHNPHPPGTAEHEAWEDGRAGVAMSGADEDARAQQALSLALEAGALLAAGSTVEAARIHGAEAAHLDARDDLAEARRVAADEFAGDPAFAPVGYDGQQLRGTSRTRYVQGYALGKNEAGQVDDPRTYLEEAVAVCRDTPQRARGEYALARGRADGARQWAADAGTLFDDGAATAGQGPVASQP